MRIIFCAFVLAYAAYAQDAEMEDGDAPLLATGDTMFPSGTMYPSGNMTMYPTNMTTVVPSDSMMPSGSPSEAPSLVPTGPPPPTGSPTGPLTGSPTSKVATSQPGVTTTIPLTLDPATAGPTATPVTDAPTSPPTTSSPTTSPRCGLCEDTGSNSGDFPLNPTKVVIGLQGEITTCEDLDVLINLDLVCDIVGGIVDGVDARYYCECPGAVDPNICAGICPGGVAPVNPLLNVQGLTCAQWDDWAGASVTTETCDSFAEQSALCCTVSTAAPTVSPTISPTKSPSDSPTSGAPTSEAPTSEAPTPSVVLRGRRN